jgi:hypothetical protein
VSTSSGKAAGGAEGERKNFSLLATRGAFGEQIEAAGAHFGVVFVGEQLDAVVEAPTGREQSWHRREQSKLADSWVFLRFFAPVSHRFPNPPIAGRGAIARRWLSGVHANASLDLPSSHHIAGDGQGAFDHQRDVADGRLRLDGRWRRACRPCRASG